MITLRKLQLKDVPLMLEWMHDEEAKHIFQNNFCCSGKHIKAFLKLKMQKPNVRYLSPKRL